MNNPMRLKSRRAVLENRYKSARISLLLVIIFTVINIVLLVSKSYTYFLFSATIPYFFADMGMYMTGMYPPEYYFMGASEFYDSSVFAFMISLAALVLLVYFLFWLMSKNGKYGWMIAALVFFSVDTCALIFIYGMAEFLDVLFHAWVIIDLALGINACTQIKKLPSEEEIASMEYVLPRVAETGVKERILLKTSALGKEIIYRRANGMNELVIDGMVYAEIELFVEKAHKLSTVIDEHEIEVGFDGAFTSYVMLDGQIIEKKKRFF